jgi:hypothetical protein
MTTDSEDPFGPFGKPLAPSWFPSSRPYNTILWPRDEGSILPFPSLRLSDSSIFITNYNSDGGRIWKTERENGSSLRSPRPPQFPQFTFWRSYFLCLLWTNRQTVHGKLWMRPWDRREWTQSLRNLILKLLDKSIPIVCPILIWFLRVGSQSRSCVHLSYDFQGIVWKKRTQDPENFDEEVMSLVSAWRPLHQWFSGYRLCSLRSSGSPT